jgi:hypothetical protein
VVRLAHKELLVSVDTLAQVEHPVLVVHQQVGTPVYLVLVDIREQVARLELVDTVVYLEHQE